MGAGQNDILRVRLTELETRRKQIEAELSTAVVHAPVTLHPNAAGLYAARVGELESALNDPDLIVEATRAIRSLVQQIVLTPDEASAHGLAVDLHGDWALILSLASGHAGPARVARQFVGPQRKTPHGYGKCHGCGESTDGGCGDRI